MFNYISLIQNQNVQKALILLLGITIGVIFYPTSRIEEKVSNKYEQQMTALKEEQSKVIADLSVKHDKAIAEQKTIVNEYSIKIKKMDTQIRDLQSKQKTAYYKIVRPDGTIEIKKFTESETTESTQIITQIQSEYNSKLKNLESKWTSIHEERVSKITQDFKQKEETYNKTILEYQKSKIITKNERSTEISVGYLTNSGYYADLVVDVWGPFFVDVNTNISGPNSTGIGIGIKF